MTAPSGEKKMDCADSYYLLKNKYLSFFEKELSNYLGNIKSVPQTLNCAVRYAVGEGGFGGKRIRPLLVFAVADLSGTGYKNAIEYALSIEFIHSYSLIHDDLPSMDNDDYRRGRFSTHKKFGEANAILTGDALNTLAFEVCLNKKEFSENDWFALAEIGKYSGMNGMVGGQVCDLENENKASDEKNLLSVYEGKTVGLIKASVLSASRLSGGKYYDPLSDFAENYGLMFQFTDDVLDVEGRLADIGKTPHKDADSGKLTSVAVFGLDGAKAKIKEFYENCLKALSEIPNSDFLKELTRETFSRNK